ncbi:MAG: pilin [Candidatus Taylorbacteria bacterium]|nr:pilin [Candidatus Taylorbacteria bacterium]
MKKISKIIRDSGTIVWMVFVLTIATFPAFVLADPVTAPNNGVNTGTSQTVTQSSQGNASTATLQNPLKVNSLGDAINTAVDIFTYIAIIGAVLAFIVIGLQFILARGNPTEISKAREWLWYAIIGTAIVLGARVIIQIVLATLNVSGAVKPEILQSAQSVLGR